MAIENTTWAQMLDGMRETGAKVRVDYSEGHYFQGTVLSVGQDYASFSDEGFSGTPSGSIIHMPFANIIRLIAERGQMAKKTAA